MKRRATVFLALVALLPVPAGAAPPPLSGTASPPRQQSPGNLRPPRVSVSVFPRTFAPGHGERATFKLNSGGTAVSVVYVTITVHAVDGRRVRVLSRDSARTLNPGANAPTAQDYWDARGDDGAAVPGGIYVLNVVYGVGPGVADGATRTPVVVVR